MNISHHIFGIAFRWTNAYNETTIRCIPVTYQLYNEGRYELKDGLVNFTLIISENMISNHS